MGLSIKHSTSAMDQHSCNVAAVLNLDGQRVVSGADDGKFKVWSPCLQLLTEVDSESGAFLSLTAGPDAIYSCTSDETIKIWDRGTIKNLGRITTSLLVPQKIFCEPKSNVLWVGDSQGRVAKYVNSQEISVFDLTEEIWDVYVTDNPTLVITARDRDVLVSEIVSGSLRSNAVTKATVSGRYPITVINQFLCCLDREGRKIQVHDNNVDNKFKLVREITAGEMIVNALCPGKGTTVYSGGYDGEVSLWDLTTGSSLGAVQVGSCVNALAPAEQGVYAALTDGRILLIGPE